MNVGYGRKVLTDNASVSVSSSKSNMNSNGTSYQNGLFVNVDEEHNNTKNMTLSGFNQVGGKVTGNIQNLTIESKQNTSTTTGSTKGGSIGFAPNGMPTSISANYSQTNGERKYVDDPTTFIIGEGSNLKVGKVENTAAAIGTSGNGKLSIDEYVGYNLENKDKTTTKGGSVSLSQSSIPISGVGINYANRDLESVTKNTVVGNVSIGKSSGDEINKDLASMTEVTKDEDTKTNVFVESQTIRYAVNPESFKEDLQKAKNEIHDIYHAVDSTVNPQGKESRNVLQQLAETRQAKTIYNVVDSRLQIAENQEDIAKAFEGVSEDLGYKVKVIYTDPSKSPQLIGTDKDGNEYIKDGTAYVDKKTGINYILINSESPANRTKAGVIGTIAEEQSHIIGKIEGRQKTVPDGSEKGLESLGRPTNDYFKNQYSKNDKAIGIISDGRDYSNVDFGENVGDASNPEDLKFKKYYREEILPKDPNYKKVKFLVSTGTNMIPGVGEVKLGIEMFVGEDLLTKEKYDLIDIIQTTTMLSKNIASRGMSRLENQLSNSKNSQNLKTELDTRNQQGQNSQQHQSGQNSLVQNNKNNPNNPQVEISSSDNQQVSKGSTSNNQQEAPVSKTSVINDKPMREITDATQKANFDKLKPINLDKLKVVENSTPEEANLYWRKNAGYTNKPYDENYEVKLVKNNGEKFVRVYTPSMGTRKASAWFMREKDIIGLTPEEIKDKYALPYTPTHVVDVKIGSVTIRTGVVKEVEGWGKGKGQQFDTNGTRLSEKQFINEREIGEKYEKK